MTPRQADVAYVLESVPGVRAVYAVEPGRVPLDFVVHIDLSPRVLASAHFALLRVVSHQDCERILLMNDHVSPGLGSRLRPLVLTAWERDGARARVPAPPPLPLPLPLASSAAAPAAVSTVEPRLEILVVGGTREDVCAVRDVFDVAPATTSDVLVAVGLTRMKSFDAILCDAARAFGEHGLFAALPLESAQRVLVVGSQHRLVDARWRLQGNMRLVARPICRWRLRERVYALATMGGPIVLSRAAASSPKPRRASVAPLDEALRVLFVDVDADVTQEFRRQFGEAAGELLASAPEQAAERVLSERFHLVVCSATAALHPTGFLATLARQDARAADRVVVLVPALDAAFVREELERQLRRSTVLALPLEDAAVRRVVLHAYPPVASQVAMQEVGGGVAVAAAPRVAYRRLSVLVVDDDTSTQILFAASSAHPDADIALATTTMEAFEHVVSRPVDVLVVSASLRGEGEPFYRVLWRLQPELKARTVLIVAPDAMPPSAPASTRPRILERPVSRDAVGRVAVAFRAP